jgi:predicted SprT family Zn-dependent metalloprotease
MELTKTKNLANKLMDKHLGTNREWNFKFDSAKVRFGQCSWGGRGKWISLSKSLVLLNSEIQITDTILHEIAHAMDVEERGYSNHDTNWTRIAKSIGCNGERCYKSSDVIEPKAKYTVKCNNCNKTHQKHRKPKRNSSACGSCCNKHNGGRYTDKFKLVYVNN